MTKINTCSHTLALLLSYSIHKQKTESLIHVSIVRSFIFKRYNKYNNIQYHDRLFTGGYMER